jgi:hypothetical protein
MIGLIRTYATTVFWVGSSEVEGVAKPKINAYLCFDVCYGSFGSEFTRLMPGTGANLKVGWIKLDSSANRMQLASTGNISILGYFVNINVEMMSIIFENYKNIPVEAELKVVLANVSLPYQEIIGVFSDPPPSKATFLSNYWELYYRFTVPNGRTENFLKFFLISKVYYMTFNVPVQEYVYDINSEHYRKFTAPEPGIQADHPYIVGLANNITEGETNPLMIARKIFDYIRENVKYGTDGEMDALSVLQNKRGICFGQAAAFVALLRAKGIPSRIVSALCPNHASAEFYLPSIGWIPVDPTWGEFACIGTGIIGYMTSSTEGITNTYPTATASGAWGRLHTYVFQGFVFKNITLFTYDNKKYQIPSFFGRNFGDFYFESVGSGGCITDKLSNKNIKESEFFWKIDYTLNDFTITKNYIENAIRNMVDSVRNQVSNASSSPSYDKAFMLIQKAEAFLNQGAIFTATIKALEALNALVTLNVILDTTPPTTSHNYDGLWHTSDITIVLSSNDILSGVSEIYYRVNNGPIKRVSVDGQPVIITEGANNTLEYWSVDNAGNEEPHKILTEIKLDKTAPTGSIMINNNAVYTNTISVTLILSASDITSGVVQMRFSHDNITWSSWEPCSTSKPWVLTTGDGTKTAYVQFRDNAGLISYSYLDTIVLDTTAPTILIASPSPGYEARSSTLTVTWMGSDETSGINSYEIRLDKGPWINVGTNTTHTLLGLSDGDHTICVKAMDIAGNSKETKVSFTVNTSLIGGPGWVDDVALFGVTCLLTVIALTVILHKRRQLTQFPKMGGSKERELVENT